MDSVQENPRIPEDAGSRRSARLFNRVRLPGMRAVYPALLVLAAFCYYGSYYRHGFEPADEGSVALLSQRLLAGERPIIDVALGYNVLWFYPIVALFAIAGVNFVAMKAFFCCLAGVTALLGYFLIHRITGRPWFAFVVGLLLIACPGSLYKTYIPLIIAGNAWMLFRFLRRGRQWRDAAAGGLLLGASFLIRIDIGILLLAVWLGILLAGPLLLDGTRAAFARIGRSVLMLAGGTLLAHAPFAVVAGAQGFLYEFLCQYSVGYYIISQPVISTFRKITLPARVPQVTTGQPLALILLPLVEAATPVSAAPPAATEEQATSGGTTLRRTPFRSTWMGRTRAERLLAFLTYAPALAALLYGLLVGFSIIRNFLRRERAPEPLIALAILGAAFCAFPQFFFFRPDIAHLSEFMPGYIVAAAVGIWFLLRRSSGWMRAANWATAVMLAGVIFTCAFYLLSVPGGGTFNVRIGKRSFFRGENGVRVYLKKREAVAYRAIKEVVQKHAGPGDYVVCHPYAPGINLFTDRPTYERSLYVDDAHAPERWQEETIGRIVDKQPAVIILNDWAINGTEASKFSNWAGEVKAFVVANYHFQGDFKHFEVYTRSADPPTSSVTPDANQPMK